MNVVDKAKLKPAAKLLSGNNACALGAVADVLIVDGNTPFLLEEPGGPRVLLRVKADQDCASVAAASVVAKVERDELMGRLHADHPHYGWESNKGYGAAALRRVDTMLGWVRGYAMIPAFKGIMAHLSQDPRWLRVRAPLVALTATEQAALSKAWSSLQIDRAQA